MCRVNADAGVANLEYQLVVRTRRGQGDVAPFGEFDRIGEQVEQNLPQAQGVRPAGGRKVVGQFQAQGEVLGFGSLLHQFQRLAQQAGKIHGQQFDFEHPGFHFREIENVVDDAEQQAAGVGNFVEEDVSLAARAFGTLADMGQAQHAV